MKNPNKSRPVKTQWSDAAMTGAIRRAAAAVGRKEAARDPNRPKFARGDAVIEPDDNDDVLDGLK